MATVFAAALIPVAVERSAVIAAFAPWPASAQRVTAGRKRIMRVLYGDFEVFEGVCTKDVYSNRSGVFDGVCTMKKGK